MIVNVSVCMHPPSREESAHAPWWFEPPSMFPELYSSSQRVANNFRCRLISGMLFPLPRHSSWLDDLPDSTRATSLVWQALPLLPLLLLLALLRRRRRFDGMQPRLSAVICMAVVAWAVSSQLDCAYFLPESFDLERDGDVELREVAAFYFGQCLGYAQWVAASAYTGLSTFAVLIAVGVGFLILQATVTSIQSRVFCCFVLKDYELARALAKCIEMGQLQTTRRFKLAGRVQSEKTQLARPPRTLQLKPVHSWRKLDEEPEEFELDIDRRFASRLCVWHAERNCVAAASLLQLLGDALALLLFTGRPLRRTYFYYDARQDAAVRVHLLRQQRDDIWPVIEAARVAWFAARDGQTEIKRMERALDGFPQHGEVGLTMS